MLRIEFASGRPKLPFDASSVAITSGGTTTATYTFYLALQGQNPIGFNLPSNLAGPFTIAPGQQMVITIQAFAQLPGESWQNLVISASTTNNPTTLVQLAKLPGSSSLPATITLDNDNAFALSSVVPTQSALPTNPVNGQLRGVADLSYVYEFDANNALTPNATTVLAAPNGRWLRRGAVFGTNVDDVTGAGGCAQDIRDVDPSQVRAPLYAADRSVGPFTRFWLNNTDTSAVPAGKRVGLIVLINGEPKSQTFDSLFLLVFRGYANSSTGALRTTRADGSTMDGVDEQIRFSANKSNLILQDDLQPGEAYTLDVAPNFDIFDFSGRDLPNNAVISIFPFLYTQSGSYSEAGAVVGDVIYPEGDLRLIVPSIGLSANALQGSGMVDSFGFLGVAPSVVTGLAANTAGQALAINHDGEVAVRPLPLPSTEAIRALVGTIDGIGNASSLSANTDVPAGSILSITCIYPCSSTGVGTIRLNYPDAKIAGLAKGFLNASRVTLYLRRASDGQLRSFAGNTVIANASQTFTISSWGAGTTLGEIPANPNPAFGLFAPGGCAIAPTSGSSDLIADNYQASFAFVYQNTITSISHDEALGCLLTATATLAQLEERSRYWAEAVANVAALRQVSQASIYPYQTRLNVELNKPYRYNPSSYAPDDGYSIVKPNQINDSLPGRWVLDDSSTWYSGSGAPAVILGAIGDYYLETDASISTVGNVWQKGVNNTWSIAGNIRGPEGQPPSIVIGNIETLPAGSTPTVTDTGDLRQAVFNFGIPTGPVGATGPAVTISVGSVTTLDSGTQATVANSGSSSQAIFDFGIPSGQVGATGPPGPSGAAATVGIGTVTTLPPENQATVNNSGSSSNAVLNFGIPQGGIGPSGSNATFSIGTISTLSPGSAATVNNSGTASNAILNFGIPQGAMGALGPPGFSPTRTTTAVTTGTLPPGGTARTTITIARNAQIFTLSTNVAARVQLYQDDASASADSSRTAGTYPDPGTGLIMEVITIDSQLTWNLMRTPFAANLQPPPATSFPILITNNEQYSTAVTVTLAILILEQ